MMLGMGCLLFLVYIIPAIVAQSRSATNTNAIAVLNLLLGWTFIGWVGALIWAMCDKRKLA